MIIKQYIKDFENLGFGLFIHFGLYSTIGRGEWAYELCNYSSDEYANVTSCFSPKADWAENLAFLAKSAGCKVYYANNKTS